MAGEPEPAALQPGVLTGTRYDAPPAPPAKVEMTIGGRHNDAKEFPQPRGDTPPAADRPTPPLLARSN
jgi:hypothetical protein